MVQNGGKAGEKKPPNSQQTSWKHDEMRRFRAGNVQMSEKDCDKYTEKSRGQKQMSTEQMRTV